MTFQMHPSWQHYLQQHHAQIQFDRVISYGNLPQELSHALTTDIIVDLSHRGLIKISGPDAAAFLQGQLTCDVREVNNLHSSLAAHCNHKGRILALFYLLQRHDNYFMLMPKSIIPPTIAQLQKYAIFSRVKIEDYAENLLRIGLSGPSAETLLQQQFTTIPQHPLDTCQQHEVTIIRLAGKFPRFFLLAPPTHMPTLWQSLSTHAQACGADAWQLLNIQANIPTIYPVTLGKFTPHQINLPQLGAVSFNKGCYTGQEVIARMQHLGKLKSHLYQAWVSGDQLPKPGNKIITHIDDKEIEVGDLIVAKPMPPQGYQLLAVLKDDYAHAANCYLNQQLLKVG
jgi:folate-binding protein YgfZ